MLQINGARPHLPLRPGIRRKEKSSGPAKNLNRPSFDIIIDLSALYSTPKIHQ
jgi:hypothetical protein